MSKRKSARADWEKVDTGTAEAFGRLDALYHNATGGRLDRSGDSLETIQHLLCCYGMDEIEGVWAWWMREPDCGRDCSEPLAYFSERSIYDDIHALAIADTARARLLAQSQAMREAATGQEEADGGRGSK